MENVITLPTSTCRRPVGGYQNQDMRGARQRMINQMGGAPVKVASRRSSQQQNTTNPRGSNTYQQRRAHTLDTDQDTQIAPSARAGAKVQPAQRDHRDQRPPRQGRHPLVWICLTLFVLWLVYLVGTAGASWWTVHLSDPPQFGPLHGTTVMGTFGGGDSEAQPSRLIGWNDNGQVRIIFIHADDPSKGQILTGPNLVMDNFPDPTGAEVQLQTGHFPTASGSPDTNLDLRVTILSTTFDVPFIHRYQQPYTLYGDGQGHLKPQGGG